MLFGGKKNRVSPFVVVAALLKKSKSGYNSPKKKERLIQNAG
jgi:hypothetical protein